MLVFYFTDLKESNYRSTQRAINERKIELLLKEVEELLRRPPQKIMRMLGENLVSIKDDRDVLEIPNGATLLVL